MCTPPPESQPKQIGMNQARRAQVQVDQKALDRIDRSIRGIITAIEDGMYQPAMKARMQELERQKAEIAARMADIPADLPDVNPNVSKLYRAKAARLVETVNDPEGGREVAEAIRALIGGVVLTPGPNRGEVHASLRGELMAILDLANGSAGHRARGGNGAKAEGSTFMTKAIASPRNQLNLRCQRITNPSPETGWGFCLATWLTVGCLLSRGCDLATYFQWPCKVCCPQYLQAFLGYGSPRAI